MAILAPYQELASTCGIRTTVQVLPVQSSCHALQLGGMLLCSVDKVTGSAFGHLHDEVVYVASDLTGPQKELISVRLQLLHGEMKMDTYLATSLQVPMDEACGCSGKGNDCPHCHLLLGCPVRQL